MNVNTMETAACCNDSTYDAAITADVTAQAAQAIAASASSYSIPPGCIANHDSYAGFAVDQTTTATFADSVAAAQNHQAGVGFMVFDASTVTPGISDLFRVAGHCMGAANVGYHSEALSFREESQNQNISPSGRQIMDALIEEQKRALTDLNQAEDELKRAEERFAKAKEYKVTIDSHVNAVAESSIEEFLAENNRWNDMFRVLVEYKRVNGHCHVMRNPKQNKSMRRKKSSENYSLQSLRTWVGQVRLDARRPPGHPDCLSPYKVIALNKLGFDWEPRENYWMDMFEQLKSYLEKSGGKMPPRFIDGAKFPLGQWCDTQLDNYRKFHAGKDGAYITQGKIDMLNQIGFIWDKRGQMWRENYKRLKEFKALHGHCNATASNNGGDKSFGTWVTKQKRKYANWKEGETESQELSLTDDQAALMDLIGFDECVKTDGRKCQGIKRPLDASEKTDREMVYQNDCGPPLLHQRNF